MLSRVAECLFWMSRYIERAENTARFVDVNQELTLDAEGGTDAASSRQWEPIVAITGDRELFASRYPAATRKNVLQFLAFDDEYPNSILSCLKSARENARSVRENVSTAMWEELNKAYLAVKAAAKDSRVPESPFEFLTQVRLASQLFVGITDGTMSHGEGWHFVRLGRLMERADKTSRMLDVKYYMLLPDPEDVGSTLDVVQWSALLKSAGALAMYRKRWGRITPTRVAGFLLLNLEFPRSVRFCLVKAEESLRSITGSSEGTYANRAERLLGRLRSDMDYNHIDDVIAGGMHEFIDEFQTQLNHAGTAVHECFFAWNLAHGGANSGEVRGGDNAGEDGDYQHRVQTQEQLQ